MKKTLIGVLPLVDPERNSFWMHPGYLHGIEQAGGLPVVLPMTMEEASLKQMVETMDGFLFTSGQDVSPELYGEAKGPHCGQCLPQRDEMEIKLLEMVLGADKPMLGICRGLQLLNVAWAGSSTNTCPRNVPQTSSISNRRPMMCPPTRSGLASAARCTGGWAWKN